VSQRADFFVSRDAGLALDSICSRMTRMAFSTMKDSDRSCSCATPSSHASKSGATRAAIGSFFPTSGAFRLAMHGILTKADIVSIRLLSLLALTLYTGRGYTVNITKPNTVSSGGLALTGGRYGGSDNGEHGNDERPLGDHRRRTNRSRWNSRDVHRARRWRMRSRAVARRRRGRVEPERVPTVAMNFRALGGVTCHADRAVGKVREDWPVMLKTALRRWSQVTPAFGCVMQRVEQTALQAVPSEFESRTQRCTGD
jgi:hypothetical protein